MLAGLLLDDTQYPGSFVLSHDLVRQTLKQSLSTARRLRLHARIAAVLQQHEPMTSLQIVDVARTSPLQHRRDIPPGLRLASGNIRARTSASGSFMSLSPRMAS